MPKQTPDQLVINTANGRQIAPGSPLSRLQSAFDDIETGVFAGDLRDVCNACDSSDKAVANIAAKVDGKLKGERVTVSTDEIEYLTAMLVAPPAMQVLEPTPVQVIQQRETKARSETSAK